MNVQKDGNTMKNKILEDLRSTTFFVNFVMVFSGVTLMLIYSIT